MSRSNPSVHLPNPSKRWFEWNGESGTVRYYDKEAKQNIDLGSDFRFILLDELSTVKGWHDPSQSGIYANEVRDTRQETLVVRSFKGGTLVEGFYRDIADRVRTLGGQYVASCYIGFKNGDGLELGNLGFKGSALAAWMEFRKAHRADLYKQAIRIHGFTEGKKGRIVFRVPVLSVAELSVHTNNVAIALDGELQKYLEAYFNRTKREQVEERDDEQNDQYDDAPEYEEPPAALTDDDIPF